jgi:hypothetical protein
MRRRWSISGWSVFILLLSTGLARAAELPVVAEVELQPLQAQAKRLAAGLSEVGQPLSKEQQAKLDAALATNDATAGIKAIQEVFDPLCLAGVTINAESRVKVVAGPAPRKLVQHGWTVFLVKVHNEAGVTAPLKCTSPNADPLHTRSKGAAEPDLTIKPADVVQRWMDVAVFNRQPLNETLSGLPLEYVLLEIYSRDAGQREAKLTFDVGQGTQDLAFRNELNALFESAPGVAVKLDVLDYDGKPTTGQFLIRDARERVYPSRARRLAPDFFFHDQIYRTSGETVVLPPGKYQFTFTRGPEYNIEKREITVPPSEAHQENFRLNRWINLAELGWFSGDHHVHAAGCGHYESPTQGVEPADMMRHILGEDLNVGCVLSWGPCWYYQKQFFEGKAHALSTDRYLMRYDVEVSGFPSSHAGHLTLLRLKDDDYPGTKRIEEWPSWDLPILAWGKEQGGVVGFSHSGWGLKVNATSLPTFEMPPFDSIGANEYIVDVTHDVCDFISTVDTPSVWELSIWYHTLNCGYTCRISGETDFPCIYGERVGLGRSYIKLPKDQPLDFDAWVDGLKDGRCYVSDGLSHLVDFRVNDQALGEPGAGGRPSVLAVKSGEKLKATARVAAMLEEKPREEIRTKPLDQKPYWHVERARIGTTRKVPVELIVNGVAVERKEIEADGKLNDIAFDFQPTQSSWVALRIFPSSHTNPVFVEVDEAPIRASKKSAQWCLDAVDVCWKQKEAKIRESEKAAAAAAYEQSRAAYRKVLEEAKVD